MAKTCMVNREIKRIRLVKKYSVKRAELKVQECLNEKKIEIPNLKSKIEKHFPSKKKIKIR